MGYKDEWLIFESGDDMDEIEHRQPSEEFLFYQAVAGGNVEAVKKNCEMGKFVESDGVGILSRNPVTNLKYHFVITTAMVTRLCRQKGMELEKAFRLSDFYIRKLDDIYTEEGVQRLHDEMVLDYTEKMGRYLRKDTNSRHINDCKEYIYAHIRERITIEDLADVFGVSASYLSRLFKKETGISAREYILSKTMETAKELLADPARSVSEVAYALGYQYPQYFSRAFKRIVGYSPNEYRSLK